MMHVSLEEPTLMLDDEHFPDPASLAPEHQHAQPLTLASLQ
jgi:hypothetical protein